MSRQIKKNGIYTQVVLSHPSERLINRPEILARIATMVKDEKYLVKIENYTDKDFNAGAGCINYSAEIVALNYDPKRDRWVVVQSNNWTTTLGQFHTIESFKIYETISIL